MLNPSHAKVDKIFHCIVMELLVLLLLFYFIIVCTIFTVSAVDASRAT